VEYKIFSYKKTAENAALVVLDGISRSRIEYVESIHCRSIPTYKGLFMKKSKRILG
jgi:hypothetical protein